MFPSVLRLLQNMVYWALEEVNTFLGDLFLKGASMKCRSGNCMSLLGVLADFIRFAQALNPRIQTACLNPNPKP